ncbi:hypothetical protein [Albibacillus kandeliae]|uniref:hypothetical protein n=1 Tax=Albibacillus kandeliae TaxID=2174228 RepID=UPI000D6931B3|nr:hypothetical protein [Albibacillus kandeliae]
MPSPKYTDKLTEKAAALREDGLSYTAIAERTGMSASAVYYHCLKLGADHPTQCENPPPWTGPMEIKRGNHVLRRFTAEEDKRILKMELEGSPVAEIARALGRRSNSVKGRLMTLARREARAEVAA